MTRRDALLRVRLFTLRDDSSKKPGRAEARPSEGESIA
jgi:hypothetical protein